MNTKNKVKMELSEAEEDLFRKTIKMIEESTVDKRLKLSRVNLANEIFMKFSIPNCITTTGTLDGHKLMQMVHELRALLLKEQILAIDAEAKLKVLMGTSGKKD